MERTEVTNTHHGAIVGGTEYTAGDIVRQLEIYDSGAN